MSRVFVLEGTCSNPILPSNGIMRAFKSFPESGPCNLPLITTTNHTSRKSQIILQEIHKSYFKRFTNHTSRFTNNSLCPQIIAQKITTFIQETPTIISTTWSQFLVILYTGVLCLSSILDLLPVHVLELSGLCKLLDAPHRL